MIDWTKPVTQMLRMRAGGERRADLGVERDELLDVRVGGRRFRRSARRPPRAGAGCPVKSSVPSRNRATATSSAAISAAEARGPEPAGLAGDAERREARLVGRAEVEPAGRDEVGRRGR